MLLCVLGYGMLYNHASLPPVAGGVASRSARAWRSKCPCLVGVHYPKVVIKVVISWECDGDLPKKVIASDCEDFGFGLEHRLQMCNLMHVFLVFLGYSKCAHGEIIRNTSLT